MHKFSRNLFRELAPAIASTGNPERDAAERQHVLEQCELVIHRIATEPHFKDPERFLFQAIRTRFLFQDQRWVRQVIDRRLGEFKRLVLEDPEAIGVVLNCAAYSSRGRPCRKQAIPGLGFCEAHQDWAGVEAEAVGV
ncbi:MAG TPA: hypothetical protein VIL04_08180 [Solirubrobacterales bacterium]|jgi:hypothetical protein